ncbi:MAG: ATP-binding protein [Phycisphaerae bacterium]
MLSDSIQHQPIACDIVERALDGHRVPHAYVFHGPNGVGKERFARVLASRLLEHDSWESVETHPDFHLIYRQLNRKHPEPEVRRRKATTLGIDVVREFLIARVALKSMGGVGKVFVIREGEKLQPQAQQALLKTLEEPPPLTFLILLTTSLNALLTTIMSRCQVVPFGPVPDSFVEQKLAEVHPTLGSDETTFYTKLAEGSPGRALEMVEQDLFTLGATILKDLAALDPGRTDVMRKTMADTAEALSETYRKADPDISSTEATRRGLTTVFQIISRWYADLLRVEVGASTTRMLGDQTPPARVGQRSLIKAIQRVSQAGYEIGRNVNATLCVETLATDLGRLR